jgi:F0F1-type ATP synthase epsilon subunit
MPIHRAAPLFPAVRRRKPVRLVTLPGRSGVFGAEKNAPPLVAELAPGCVCPRAL